MAPTINLGGLFTIFPDKPLPEYQSPGTQAFAVTGASGNNDTLFALVCPRDMPVRLNILQKIVKIEDGALVRLIHSGIAVWPEDSTERVVMVFERPSGKRLMAPGYETPCAPLPFDVVVSKIITPFVQLFSIFHEQNLFHGAIRPDNMFGLGNLGAGVSFGECVSAPPSVHQPILFETIQRGLCQPSGRGIGTLSDDFYAFGVSLLCLVLGRHPVPGKTDEEILQRKMDKGSFFTLVHHNRVPTGILEPLRGLLNDDPLTRWTLEDFRLWLGGRRLSPRPPEQPKRAIRPFDFVGQELWTARALALALSTDALAALKLLETGEVESWMRRALGEKNDTEFLVTELAQGRSANRNNRDIDQLLGRCLMAISPDSPVRYKGVSVYPTGLGPALTAAMIQQQNTMTIGQIITHSLCTHWGTLYQRRKIPPPAPTLDLEQVKRLMDRPSYGYGIERVLYELDPNAPCLSPSFTRHYVLTPSDLLRALEQIAPEHMRDGEPIDRHIAAFLMVRFKRLEDWLLRALGNREEPEKAAMAQITILAQLQDKLNQPVLPNLAKWAAQLGQTAVDRLHNRKAREKLMRQIEDHVRAGSITGIAALLDNPAQLSGDQNGFQAAQFRYRRIAKEIAELEQRIGDPTKFMKGYGRQLATVTSAILGSIGLFLIVGWFTLKG